MTREELSQLFYLKREIKMWQEQLDSIRMESEAKASPTYVQGGRSKNKISSTVETNVVRYRTIEEIVEDLKKKVETQEQKIMEYISEIDDSLLRQIVKYRCIDCKSWTAVSMALGGYQSPDGVRMIFNRAFPKKKRV